MRYVGLVADQLELLYGPSGWVQAITGGRHCWIHFERVGEEWRSTALFVLSPTNDMVRAIPLRRIELAVNASTPFSEALAARVKERLPGELGTAKFLAAFNGYAHDE